MEKETDTQLAKNSSSDNKVLCAASAYEKKYYFNPEFGKLPDYIQKELQITCVVFTEECGGILSMEFDRDGELLLKTECDEGDLLYDEISAGLLVNELRRDKEELFHALERFYYAYFGEGAAQNTPQQGTD